MQRLRVGRWEEATEKTLFRESGKMSFPGRELGLPCCPPGHNLRHSKQHDIGAEYENWRRWGLVTHSFGPPGAGGGC